MLMFRGSFLLIGALALISRASADTTSSTTYIDNEPNYTYDELYKLLANFWDNFIYPADVTQAKSINSTLLSENVQGRIDATRTFVGRELNTEYLFGLFANLAGSSSLSLIGVPVSYEILKFVGNSYVSSAATRVTFNLTSLGIQIPIEIDTWTSWNSLGQMTQYDGIFKWWDWLQDYVVQSAMPLLGASTETEAIEILTPIIVNEICTTAQTYCNGTNVQYSNYTSCFDFLTTQVRWGEAYEFGRNTIVCRMLHQNMVPFRPSVHCPHIGPTGGGYCTDDMTYISTVELEFFNLSWVPYPEPPSEKGKARLA